MTCSLSIDIPQDLFLDWAAEAYEDVRRELAARYRDAARVDGAATDALGKAFETYLGRPCYFGSAAHVRNWMRRASLWGLISDHRKAGRCRPLGPELLDALPSPEPDEAPGPVTPALLRDYLPLLHEQERLAIYSYYWADTTDVEVGLRLLGDGPNHKALGQRAHRLRHRALRKLRALLGRGVG